MRSTWLLTPAEAALAGVALLLVPFAAISSRVARLPRAVSLVCGLARWLPIASVADGDKTARIVNGAAARIGARCLTRALVVHAVLSRAGIACRVVVGASRRGAQLKSHAWVERDGESVSGSTADWLTMWRSGA